MGGERGLERKRGGDHAATRGRGGPLAGPQAFQRTTPSCKQIQWSLVTGRRHRTRLPRGAARHTRLDDATQRGKWAQSGWGTGSRGCRVLGRSAQNNGAAECSDADTHSHLRTATATRVGGGGGGATLVPVNAPTTPLSRSRLTLMCRVSMAPTVDVGKSCLRPWWQAGQEDAGKAGVGRKPKCIFFCGMCLATRSLT